MSRIDDAVAHDQAISSGQTGVDLQDVDFDAFNAFIGFKLRLAQECVFRGFAHAVGDPKLKPRLFTALCQIAHHPGMSQSDLGALVGRDKSTITPMISDLVETGHVRREQTAADRRSFKLYLTKKGELLLRRQWAVAQVHEARIDRVIGLDQRALFLDQLERLIAAFG
jgi:DNA-binding MarR family transcriptional regulator